MSAILLLRIALVAITLGIFAVFYSMGAAYTGFGIFLAAYSVAVLTGAGVYSGYSKLIKAAVATLLLLAGLLPIFGFGHLELKTWIFIAIQLAATSTFVVLMCPTYSPSREHQQPKR